LPGSSTPAGPLLALLPDTAQLTSVRAGLNYDAIAIRDRVAGRAIALHTQGLAHGDRVVVAELDPAEFVIAILAAWQAGLAVVAVNPALAPAEAENVVGVTGARAWLGANPPPLPPPGSPAGELRPLGIDETALILMTSGTTGRPKGIAHSQASLIARVQLNIEAIGAEILAQALCVLPVFFGHGLIGNTLTPLLAGGRVHLWPTPMAGELPRLASYLDQHGIGFMSSVPSFWKLATRMSPSPSRPLRRVHVGSAPLSIEQWRAIAAWAGTGEVHNMFGMTETANWIGGGALAEPEARDGYVGRAWGGALAVLADDGSIASSGRGEALVRSPGIMQGYWQRPDLDAAAFVQGWFRTGDIGELDAAGRLTLIGRIKTEINRGGIKVQAEEVDMLLERHPDVLEACAFGIPDPVAGEAVAAALVLKPGVTFAPEAIKAWCRTMARPDAVPSRLYAVEAIPRNDRGKIVRADVRRAVGAGP